MTILFTGDQAFHNLVTYEWPYKPNFTRLKGFEEYVVHFIDVGGNGDPNQPTYVVCHGNPTQLYLYRKMIPVFLESGARVVGMDLIGFGRSSKPTSEAVHTTIFHRNCLISFIRKMNLNDNVTLVVQDYGGILGLTLPMEEDIGQKIKGLICMNTAFGGDKMNEGFLNWQKFSNSHPNMDIAKMLQRSTGIDRASLEAYNAPFPNGEYQAAMRRFPNMVTNLDSEFIKISKRAKSWWKNQFRGQAFVACGSQDPVFNAVQMKQLASEIFNAEYLDCPHAGHFTPESGRLIAIKALQHFGRLPKPKHTEIEFVDKNVAILYLNSPPVNTMSTDFCEEVIEQMTNLEMEHAIHSVVVISKRKVFSAGADIKNLAYGTREEIRTMWEGFNRMILKFYTTPLATIIAINGMAPAGGTVLSLAGDYRIMAANPVNERVKYMVGLNESQLNLNLTTWLPRHVERVVGSHIAQKILEMGEFHSSEDALKLGMVDEVVEMVSIHQRALEVAKKYAKVGQSARQFFKLKLRQDFIDKMDVKKDAARSAIICDRPEIRNVFKKMLNRGKKKKKKRAKL